MKFSAIQEKHIYNVIFDPVRECEFNGKHLALVLKCNNDKKTFIVMPLTSESNGDNVNKIKLGKIPTLPSSLRKNDTYAVFNQIRTVNANRFINLKEGDSIIESSIDNLDFINLLQLGMDELAFHLTNDEKIAIFKAQSEKACVDKAIDCAYNIIKLHKSVADKQEEILLLNQCIATTLENVSFTLEQKHIDNGVQKVIEDAIALNKKNHTSYLQSR